MNFKTNMNFSKNVQKTKDSIQSLWTKNSQLTKFAPTNVKESRLIIADIRKGDGVLIDLSNMSPTDALRLMDIVSGSIIFVGGAYKRVANKLFLIAPNTELLEHYLETINE